ncbi:diguanylate cyclase (GGDEF)-like protein [Kineococcus xinjiangensis]|uniref:Diguanylate cyclase (GGDEF)-like protein n=1 Tax=Kineococcus xinjiangensis TaxID=512762 RepID=A0A2S6IWV0_9ACTN|nr:diguanylate cyclase [Kineococcus xinjiangensis]PPK98832.1 diguanylate cyclase (GGDEF)-like protein [Kineococcus xinjiangensis]
MRLSASGGQPAGSGATAPPTRLLHLLQRSTAVSVLALGAVVLSLLVATTYLLEFTQPTVERSTAVTQELRLNHEAMLDQETGLRAWVVTGDEHLLQPYETGRRAGTTHTRNLRGMVADDRLLAVEVEALLAAQEAWHQDWASRALVRGASTPTARGTDADRRTAAFFEEGASGFRSYRAAYARAVGHAAAQRDAAVASQRTALRLELALNVLIGVLAVVFLVARMRRLEHLLSRPLALLHEAIARVRRGETLEGLPRLAVEEFDEATAALAQLSQELHLERASTHARAEQTRRVSEQRREMLLATQALAACTSVEELTETLLTRATELSGRTASLWLPDGSGGFACTSWASLHHASSLKTAALVSRAGEDGLLRRDRTGATGLPLRVAGATLGVLHLEPDARMGVRAGVDDALQGLALSAAAHLQVLHLLAETRSMASTDQLTGLGNRRRMDEDLAAEWSRSRRHRRPLSFALLDLDHFKRVNDTAGHLVGDEWLRLVATIAQAAVRASDRVYRYGGEEIAVLLTETDEEAAAGVVERIREAVERASGPEQVPHLTTSAGLAQLHPDMADVGDLLGAADAALYAAKRGGRNRVVRASATATETLSTA